MGSDGNTPVSPVVRPSAWTANGLRQAYEDALVVRALVSSPARKAVVDALIELCRSASAAVATDADLVESVSSYVSAVVAYLNAGKPL